MVTVKTKDEIKKLKKAGTILNYILKETAKKAVIGAKTKDLDKYAEKLIFSMNAKPSFKGYHNFPASLCVSVNDEIVHGLPGERKLKEGDIVSLDLGLSYGGMFVDSAITLPVGKISAKAKKIIDAAKIALKIGILAAKPKARTGDIGFAVERYVKSLGFDVVRQLAGHGVGYAVHEAPLVPNFGEKGKGELLKEGMVLAIEPMVTEGDWRLKIAEDGFTYKTKDGKLSSHFEHTVAITKKGCEILT